MDIRELGRTRLPVTAIGVGLAAVGRPAYINLGRDRDLPARRSVDELRDRTHALLDAASAAGVRYVDVARSYGRAEEFLGSWLARQPADQPIPTVGSKWGYSYVGEWQLDAPIHEVKDHGLAAFRRQLAESRAILGERLRLYQVHSATLESGILDDQDVIGALASLADEGIVVGLSVSGARQAETVRRALDVRVDGRNPFASVQATWNVLEPSVGTALGEAHGEGWGVIVKEALANGRLAESRVAPPALSALAGRHAAGVDALAIAAAIAQPWADVVLSGAATVAQLASNLAALDVRLGAGDLDELATMAEPATGYWSSRSRLPWR